MNTKLNMLGWDILVYLKNKDPQNAVEIELGVEQKIGKLVAHSVLLNQLEQLLAKGFVERKSRSGKRLGKDAFYYQLSTKGREELSAHEVPA